jgi:hypothetical protein
MLQQDPLGKRLHAHFSLSMLAASANGGRDTIIGDVRSGQSSTAASTTAIA